MFYIHPYFYKYILTATFSAEIIAVTFTFLQQYSYLCLPEQIKKHIDLNMFNYVGLVLIVYSTQAFPKAIRIKSLL